jgi:hypothetical protein
MFAEQKANVPQGIGDIIVGRRCLKRSQIISQRICAVLCYQRRSGSRLMKIETTQHQD